MGKHYANKDVVAMLALKSDYNNLNETLSDYLYLADVDDTFIVNNYMDILVSEAHSTLEGLSIEQVKEYFDIKQRAICALAHEKEEEKSSTP